jgi:outer membrane protein OmpA-like peptidoglycan-associated protein
MSRLTSVFVFGSLFAAACGSKAPPPVEPAPPPPVAEPAPPPVEEPEADPVVKEEPKNLDIQHNVIRLKPGIKIMFDTDSDKLQDASFPILDEVASVLSQNERLRVRVEGHTDNTGKADHNKDLSTRRAASVREYLVSHGIVAERLESTGCGQDVPVAANDTEDNRAMNRRVEFVILRRRRVVEPCQVYKPGEHHRHRHGGDAAAPADGTQPAPAPAPAPATP